MTYCIYCKRPTNDKITTVSLNKKTDLKEVHCDTCGIYKHQYIAEKPKETWKNDQT